VTGVRWQDKCRRARRIMQRAYQVTSDPLYYVMGAFFALFTTVFPAVMGMPRFLPVSQALVLTIFVTVPLRQGRARHAAAMLALWIALQIIVMSVLSRMLPTRVESALPGGFALHAALLEWAFGAGPLPQNLAAQPLTRLGAFFGMTLGSYATGGLIGFWLLVQAANLAGFTFGSLAATFGGPLGFLVSLPVWSLVRIAAYGGLVVPLAEPLLIGDWSLRSAWQRRRKMLAVSLALLLLSVTLELVMPPLWQQIATALDGAQ